MNDLKNRFVLSSVQSSQRNASYGCDHCTAWGGGGGDLNIKKVGVLVSSLRGVNFRFYLEPSFQ